MKITGTLVLDTEGDGIYEVTAERDDDIFQAVIGELWWRMERLLDETDE